MSARLGLLRDVSRHRTLSEFSSSAAASRHSEYSMSSAIRWSMDVHSLKLRRVDKKESQPQDDPRERLSWGRTRLGTRSW